MDHVVYVDFQAKEMDRILDGSKRMVIRGAAGRKLPYGKVEAGDTLYFINNNGEGLIKAKAVVSGVYNSEKLTPEESERVVKEHQDQLQLTELQVKRWAGKRYLVLIEFDPAEALTPFMIDKSAYQNMDDWLPVEAIDSVTI